MTLISSFSKKSFINQLLLLSLGICSCDYIAVLLLFDSQAYFFDLISMVLKKLLKLLLANGLTIVIF